ncbi:hypothetical protein Syun_025443 [Stephania yunnanensis]|uniref:Uncharacterized protein n=1 Tax=Stephania yunnanensis TaxID=152371 RepID=A0AAP0HR96_9MAGN
MSMEGLSHLGLHCTMARDKVDGSDEHDGGSLNEDSRSDDGRDNDGREERRDDRRRGLQMQRRQTARASEAATTDDATTGRHHENSTPNYQSRDDGEKRS